MKASARFTIAIGRAHGTVVVTVHGELDAASVGHLESVLGDLIDSQETVALIVDLHDARAGVSDDLSVFARASRLAASRGGTLVLSGAADQMDTALESAGLAHLINGDRARRGGTAAAGQYRWRGVHPAGGAQHWTARSGMPENPAG